MKKIRAVSLFSGCGGGDLGLLGGFSFLGKKYKKLPYEFVWANDNDVSALETYKKNFKHTVVCADIRKISAKKIPQHDLLIGGFPCQTFSIVGQRRGFADPRGLLYREMARILKIKKPKIFIGENVKGLVSVDKGKVFRKILHDLESVGYHLHYAIVNASDYGVPQKRQRVIIVGIRKDIDKHFSFPKVLDKKSVLRDVMEKNGEVEKKYYFSRRAMEGLAKANKAFNKGRAQNPDEPCNTISTHLAKVSLNGTDPVILVKYGTYRRLTPLEAARIQSFPDNFEFIGTDAKKYIQIGNAIPPVMMWYIGREIYKQIFNNGHNRNTETKLEHVQNKKQKYYSGENSSRIPLQARASI